MTPNGQKGAVAGNSGPGFCAALSAFDRRLQLSTFQSARSLGKSQLADLKQRVEVRRRHKELSREALLDLPGVSLMEEPEGNHSTFWLTALVIDPESAGVDRDQVRLHLESLDIEARPVWKPTHLQPVFYECNVFRRFGLGAPLRARSLPARRIVDDRGPVRARCPWGEGSLHRIITLGATSSAQHV